MTDFVEAAREGMLAYDKAEKERKDIENILMNVTEQFKDVSDGRFRLIVKQATRLVRPKGQLANAFATLGLLGSKNMIYRSRANAEESNFEVLYRAVFAVCGEFEAELCEWLQETTGFPVKLKFSGKEVNCRDAVGFEDGLVDLLSNASTGEKLKELFVNAGVVIFQGNEAADPI
jgi:hypothetical protein